MTKKRKRPTASSFFDPLVKVLGRLTGYQSGVGIHYRDVVDLVLREVGIDPDDSPWPLEGSKPLGLYRVIGFAHRNQRKDTKNASYSGSRKATCSSLGKGVWGLTESGVERSRELQDADLHLPGFEPEDLIEDLETTEGDSRDAATWVVLELTRQGELKVQEGTLEESLRMDLDLDDDHPIFIPASTYERKGESVTLQLMEGYVFVASGLPEVAYFSLEECSYVAQVMSIAGPHGMRVLSTIPNSSVEGMRTQLRGMSVIELSKGDLVRVVEGRYAGLVMRYLGGESDSNYALLCSEGLRSLEVVVSLPRAFLELVSEGEELGFPISEV